MKRKIYSFILLFSFIFIVGCNKQKNQPVPTPTTEATPTSTPTPTPIPENLAKTNLDKLPEQFDNLMSYTTDNTVDYSNGIGYDVTIKFSLGQQIAELLGLADLNNISISGTVDMKDVIAANIGFYLNDSEVVNSHLFADSANLLFNFPKYSSNYAAITWEELTSSLGEEAPAEESSLDSSLTGSEYEVIRTISTVDKPLPSDEALINSLRSLVQEFTDCFVEVEGITQNASIGTGDYLLSGEKHTVAANINDLYAILEKLETELQTYYETIDLPMEDFQVEGATSFLLDYYISENGDYAWAAYPDNKSQEQLVFINTSLGFCLYHTKEDGTTETAMYSVKSSDQAGVITLLSSETETSGTINYELGNNSASIYAVFDTIELTLETSKINDTIRYNATLITNGVSVVIKETATPNHTDISCSLASYGMEYLTLSVTTDTRDYVEIPIPQNSVAMDTWIQELDQVTLSTDLLQLLQDYPFLANLFGSFGDDTEDEPIDTEDEPFALPEDYTDAFSGMTGYSVDSTGYVDFEPLEEEVLSLGEPSTGVDTILITDTQRQALLDYAGNAFADCEVSSNSFYWVWGSTEHNNVQSFYTKDYTYYDASSWDNSISITFDAVSGGFSSVDIYHEDKETALRMANELLALLGVDYTVTAEVAEEYTFIQNLYFSAYDGSQYGGNYYNVGFSVYYPEW